MLAKKSKKKAFTLTELLVIVVVLGVLAAVVLPKYRKVLESRRTTEAESILSAVRTEQERRCALDKPYLRDLSKLGDLVRTSESNYYTYATLASGSGASASSKGDLNYQLVMPSYADGRICCSGEACTQLNKDYPLCDSMTNIVYDNACLTDVGIVPPAPPASCVAGSSEDRSCEACPGVTGTQHCTCDANTGEWDCGDCFAPECEPTDCTPGETQNERCGCQNAGSMKRTCTPNGIWGQWSSCDVALACKYEWIYTGTETSAGTSGLGYGTCEMCRHDLANAGGIAACGPCSASNVNRPCSVSRECKCNGYCWGEAKGGGEDGGKGMVQPPGGGGGECGNEDDCAAVGKVPACNLIYDTYSCLARPQFL
ncbi:MAG: prepilin-type N-terminal cleavage/methylation domain-containing protein [Elusimicrobiaceae bacterium]|nr:prepilin-type N-terminal cleavage/methylation domain-containing protein [Elusimicrobiaceae bacterium]